MNWKTVISFVLLATLLTILIGWIVSIKGLPISQTIHYNNAELQFIQIWIWIALAIGLMLPAIAFLLWFNRPELRKFLGFYLLVLVIQILTEQIVSSIWFSSLVVTIGTIYTAFRVWQLWQGKQLAIDIQLDRFSHKLMSGLLWLLLLFWSSNLIMLLTLGWSSILRFES
jgi:hypothetical protein